MAHLQETYLHPDNCRYLISPKINKQIWQQLRQETRNSDSAFQKAQGILMTGLYAILQIGRNDKGIPMGHLIHAVVLLMSANRELNLKRRDLLRPDFNKEYVALCNPSTPMSTFLFGDDLNKEVEELTKLNKLSGKVYHKHRFTLYRIPSTSGVQTPSRYGPHDTRGRSSRPLRPF